MVTNLLYVMKMAMIRERCQGRGERKFFLVAFMFFFLSLVDEYDEGFDEDEKKR